MSDLSTIIDTEQSYRALLDKLIRLHADVAGVRDAYRLRSKDATVLAGVRMGCSAKARAHARFADQLAYVLSRNRKQIEALGLVMPAHTNSPATPS